MASKRNPNFETLRVVAMFLIVVWHYLVHGIGYKPIGTADDAISIANLFSLELIGCLAKISTNCYILISGYFMITSTNAKWRKIPKTWAPIFFYSVVICLLFMIFGAKHIGWETFAKSAFPLYFDKYWFATRYVALVALAPFLALIAKNISRQQYLILLAVLFILNFNLLLGKHLSGNNALLWFIFLFYAGGYIRLHFRPSGKNNYGKYYFILAAAFALFYQTKHFVHYSFAYSPFMIDYHENNGFEFFTALMIFLWTAKRKTDDGWISRLSMRIAPLTFGVYLIHDNELVRNVLWHDWIDAEAFYDSWAFVPALVATTIAIFAACIAIDNLRNLIFKKLDVNGRIDRIADRFNHITFIKQHN